jgi:hypothetical protein
MIGLLLFLALVYLGWEALFHRTNGAWLALGVVALAMYVHKRKESR